MGNNLNNFILMDGDCTRCGEYYYYFESKASSMHIHIAHLCGCRTCVGDKIVPSKTVGAKHKHNFGCACGGRRKSCEEWLDHFNREGAKIERVINT